MMTLSVCRSVGLSVTQLKKYPFGAPVLLLPILFINESGWWTFPKNAGNFHPPNEKKLFLDLEELQMHPMFDTQLESYPDSL